MDVAGVATFQDNATVNGAFAVTGPSNLSGDVAIGGNLTLGTLTITGLTSNINTDNATIGTLYTDTIKSADGQMNLIRKKMMEQYLSVKILLILIIPTM